MTFMAIAVVFLLVQLLGSVEPMQADGWFRSWSARARGWVDGAALQLLLQLLVPLLGLWLVLDLADDISLLLLFLVTVPLLLYSLGRGDIGASVEGYLGAFRRDNNELAADYAERLGVDLSAVDDWPKLHVKVLQCAGYRGFERWFAVLFWFVLLGPLGAVFYRLVALVASDDENSVEVRWLAQRLLWNLEWPVVRLVGLSFGLTGNFSSCYSHSLETLLDTDKSSAEVLEIFIHGALNVNDRDIAVDGVREQEIEALQRLLRRTLILWVCVLALLSMI